MPYVHLPIKHQARPGLHNADFYTSDIAQYCAIDIVGCWILLPNGFHAFKKQEGHDGPASLT